MNRKGYEAFHQNRKPRNGYKLSQERIDKLDSIGFVWKLRHGRPKKGDAKFRNKALGIGYNSNNDVDGGDEMKNDNGDDDGANNDNNGNNNNNGGSSSSSSNHSSHGNNEERWV